MPESLWPWVIFNVFVVLMLALDLGVFHRKAHEIHMKEALGWTAVWIGLALVFNVFIYYWKGHDSALQFLAGYLIEKSLSVDNIFVFIVIFSSFQVKPKYQHEVLFWGILGALIMRAIFIAAGVTLMHKFHWIIYVFGAFLVYTGVKLAFHGGTEVHPEKNPILTALRRFLPVTHEYQEGKFFVRQSGKIFATPLFIVLVTVELTDVIFAVDSIPAVLAVTKDPFIVYTSNVFAILGLRALYFALAGMTKLFHYLHYGLAAILSYVGVKMLLADVFPIPIHISLLVIVVFLALSIGASVLNPKKPEKIKLPPVDR